MKSTSLGLKYPQVWYSKVQEHNPLLRLYKNWCEFFDIVDIQPLLEPPNFEL